VAVNGKPLEVASGLSTPTPDEVDVQRAIASISYSEVRKVYDGRGAAVTALGPVTLDVQSGDFVSIIGPSGCGKSTLLRMTAGLVRPTCGTIVMAGRQVEKTRVDIGFVFQDPVLLPWKKILANVLFQIEMRDLRPADYLSRARELIDLVGLKGFEDRYPSELSGGMQQFLRASARGSEDGRGSRQRCSIEHGCAQLGALPADLSAGRDA
jgi:ABC-type nitrate/sulfonate/bicarbonate transport system ATPase subunit